MKLDKKAIKEFARRNMQYDTDNPFEATLRAVETWMGKNRLVLLTELEVSILHGLKEVQPPETGEALSAEGEPD